MSMADHDALGHRVDYRRITLALLAATLLSLALPACERHEPEHGRAAGAANSDASPRANYDQYFRTNLPAAEPAILRRTAVFGAPDSFGLPIDLAVVGEQVIVLDTLAVPGVAIIDRDDGSIQQLEQLGGPSGRASSPSAITDHDDSSVWLYFGGSGLWARFHVDALRDEPLETVQLPTSLSQPLWVGDQVLSTGLFAGELLRIFDVEHGRGTLITGRARPPLRGLEPDLAIHINRTRLATDLTGGRFVLAFRYLSRLYLFDDRGVLDRTLAGPEEVVLRYRTVFDEREGIDRLVPHDDTTLAYLGVAATDELIFALYSGRRHGDAPDVAGHGREIHVFGWDGRWVGAWHVEDDLYNLDVDPATQTLLGLRELPFPAIVEYKLESLTREPTVLRHARLPDLSTRYQKGALP